MSRLISRVGFLLAADCLLHPLMLSPLLWLLLFLCLHFLNDEKMSTACNLITVSKMFLGVRMYLLLPSLLAHSHLHCTDVHTITDLAVVIVVVATDIPFSIDCAFVACPTPISAGMGTCTCVCFCLYSELPHRIHQWHSATHRRHPMYIAAFYPGQCHDRRANTKVHHCAVYGACASVCMCLYACGYVQVCADMRSC